MHYAPKSPGPRAGHRTMLMNKAITTQGQLGEFGLIGPIENSPIQHQRLILKIQNYEKYSIGSKFSYDTSKLHSQLLNHASQSTPNP